MIEGEDGIFDKLVCVLFEMMYYCVYGVGILMFSLIVLVNEDGVLY